jgi:anti-sigma factor ChrR (cupin superfamily)
MTEKVNPGEPRFLFTDAVSMPWRASAWAEGVEVKDLGTANGRSMQLVRCRPGTIFPTHRHRGPEFIYILEGDAIQNGQRLGPGWAGVAEAGTLDEQFRSETGCVFLIVYSE